MDIAKKKEWVETIQSAVTIVAIIIGGIWTYLLFVAQREKAPHATVEVKTTVIPLTDAVNLLQVDLKLQNTGHTLIPVTSATARIQNVLPLWGCSPNDACATRELNEALDKPERVSDKFDWPLLANRDSDTPNPVEPRETANLQFEFVIPASVKVARVYGFVENNYVSKGKEPRSGWLDVQFVTIAEVKSTEPTKCKSDTPHP